MSLLQMPKADFCCCCCALVLPQLKRCGLGYNLVSALTNVRKYVAWEGLSCEKAAGRASNLRDTRDWDLFADSEYRRLVETEDEANGGGGGEGEEEGKEAGGEEEQPDEVEAATQSV